MYILVFTVYINTKILKPRYNYIIYIISFIYFPNRFLISSDTQLRVKVQGARPENILLLVHEVLESLILEFFKGTHYEYQLPCTDCIKTVGHHIYVYQN